VFGYLVNLFYASTLLADPRWPPKVQNTALLFSLIAAIVVSVACAQKPKRDLKRYLKWSTIVAIVFILLSLACYWTLHKPLVDSHGTQELIDDVWIFIDFISMISLILIVTFASMIGGQSVWDSFSPP
jgi:Na+-driven multidrug efflux pump